jgi:uroporphyrin-III C-methyltransferase
MMGVRTAVVLAAHGSRSDATVGERIDALAARLARRGLADVVVAAYHAGAPSFDTVLDSLDADRIAVVPLLTSDGFYNRSVLPSALRRNARASRPGWRISAPVGTHPALAAGCATAVRHTISQQDLLAEQCEVVVAGHGTTRVASSQESTFVLAHTLSRVLGIPATALYLDAEPALASIWDATSRPHVIVVPFLFGGGHLRDDLPQRIGESAGRTVTILDGLLALDTLDGVVAERAREALLSVGTVTLVGAGPGDPGLITVRGLDALRAADVVVHDRLVARELLSEVQPDATLIDVGKRAGDEAAAQLRINALLVEHALAGSNVVRLKGGDSFVFGRGSEEIDACAAAGVPYAVVPGVTSAIAAPAAAGIPVTERSVARSFAVVTARTADEPVDSNTALCRVAHADTLVVMMGAASIGAVAAQLMAAGRSPSTSVAIVSHGTMIDQRVMHSTLERIEIDAATNPLPAPLVLIIGDVTRRAQV